MAQNPYKKPATSLRNLRKEMISNGHGGAADSLMIADKNLWTASRSSDLSRIWRANIADALHQIAALIPHLSRTPDQVQYAEPLHIICAEVLEATKCINRQPHETT